MKVARGFVLGEVVFLVTDHGGRLGREKWKLRA